MTYPQFLDNLKRVGVADHVTPVVATSEEAAARWDRPIRLLFLDGDHAYAPSKKDFEAWSPFVVSAGDICFHDIGQWPGVTPFYQALMGTPGPYQELPSVCGLKVIHQRP